MPSWNQLKEFWKGSKFFGTFLRIWQRKRNTRGSAIFLEILQKGIIFEKFPHFFKKMVHSSMQVMQTYSEICIFVGYYITAQNCMLSEIRWSLHMMFRRSRKTSNVTYSGSLWWQHDKRHVLRIVTWNLRVITWVTSCFGVCNISTWCFDINLGYQIMVFSRNRDVSFMDSQWFS